MMILVNHYIYLYIYNLNKKKHYPKCKYTDKNRILFQVHFDKSYTHMYIFLIPVAVKQKFLNYIIFVEILNIQS